MPLSKPLRWLIYLVIASVAMYVVASLILSLDKSRPAIEKFVASNKEIVARVGTVQNLDLIKKTSVSATETSSSYRLYTFTVFGDKAKATIVVRAEQTDQNGVEKLQIVSTTSD